MFENELDAGGEDVDQVEGVLNKFPARGAAGYLLSWKGRGGFSAGKETGKQVITGR